MISKIKQSLLVSCCVTVYQDARPGTRDIHEISINFQIRHKYLCIYFLPYHPDHNDIFTYAKTAVLSWHMQNSIVIRPVFSIIKLWEFSPNSEFGGKISSSTSFWPSCHCHIPGACSKWQTTWVMARAIVNNAKVMANIRDSTEICTSKINVVSYDTCKYDARRIAENGHK